MNVKIIDIFWDRIYLNIIFQGKDIDKNEIFLKSKVQKIKLEIKQLEENKYSSVINITNIRDITMLKNEEYLFIAKKQDKVEEICIETDLGYKLEKLDKIYRYSDQNLAYTVTFIPEERKNKQKHFQVSSEVRSSEADSGSLHYPL